MRSLEGKTALVAGGGEEIGRAIALALSARGVRVLVVGPAERALGETVGEVVHGGGKARHLVGDVMDAAFLASAVERAIEVFGSLDIAVAAASGSTMGAECMFKAARPRLGEPGRLFALAPAGAVVRATAQELKASRSKVTCLAVGGAPDAEPEDLAALLVLLCAPAAARLAGQVVRLGSP